MAPSRGWTPWVTRIAAKPQHLTNETRMATIEVKVPDIGDYRDVPVIELLVAVGDTVNKDQGLVTLESDKATMEVPSPSAGVVRELKVKVGDALSEGSVVAVLEAGATANPPSPPGKGAGGEGSAKPAAVVDPVPSAGPAGQPLPGGEGKAPAVVAGPKPAADSGRCEWAGVHQVAQCVLRFFAHPCGSRGRILLKTSCTPSNVFDRLP